MKKIYTLLVLPLLFFAGISKGQTNCSPAFTFTISNTNHVQFTPAVVGDANNTIHTWYFGNGALSIAFLPAYDYLNAGVYSVKHIITRFANGAVYCADSTIQTVIIADVCNLNANFSSANLQGSTFSFSNTSTSVSPSDSVKWNFGDGATSNAFSPVHTFATGGIYRVCLRIQKRNSAGVLQNCISEKCDSVVATTAQPCSLVATFLAYRDSLNAAPNVFHFVNTSNTLLPSDSVRWTFGDGSPATNTFAPTHTYAQPGTYMVCLRVIRRDANGTLTTCVRENCITITVASVCNLHAAFTSHADSLLPRKIYFTNQSSPLATATTFLWTFGDGTSSAQQNPLHEYANSGRHRVCLRVSTGNCVSEICDSLTILSPLNCSAVQVGFTDVRDSINFHNITFHAVANAGIVQQTWSVFRLPRIAGSLPIATLQGANPSYNFADTGMYSICLRAVTSGNCIKEICREIRVWSPATNVCNLNVYPNPAHNEIHGAVYLERPQVIRVYIYNINQVLVKQRNIDGVTGNNTFNIAINDLVAGNYILKVVHENVTCYRNFLKL